MINRKIHKLQVRALRIVCKDHFSSFEALLSKTISVTVYQRNFQILTTEMYKMSNRLSPDVTQDIFDIKSNYYYTRNALVFSSRNIKAVRSGLQTIFYIALKILDLVPEEILLLVKNCPCQLVSVHYIRFFKMTNVVGKSARGSSLSGNANVAVT